MESKEIRRQLDIVRAALDEVAKDLSAKHGISLRPGLATFTREGGFSMKLEGAVRGGITREAEYYNLMRDELKLPPLGTQFAQRGEEHTVVGLRKTKVLTRAASGKMYLFGIESVRWLALGARP